MKKNILHESTIQEIIDRSKSLQPTDRARWGTMTVAEMLRHCTLANRQILHGELSIQAPTLKQRMIGFLCLYVLPAFPKNIRGAESIDTKGKVRTDEFETVREDFIRTISMFRSPLLPFRGTHPAFGNLTTAEWGKSIWMHMDHHLRQFGA